ncbi:serine/threonine-protein kinase VRK3 isoform X2 [Tiliqua scincoides]
MQITPTPSVKELFQKDKNELPQSPAKKRVTVLVPGMATASASVKHCLPGRNTTDTTSPKDKAKLGPRSPRKDRRASVGPLPEGQILTDQNNKQWTLVKLLSQSDCGLLYEAKSTFEAPPRKKKYSLKLDAKEGKLFNEQNFLLRAAKKATVEKWKRQYSVPLLGIPTCIGFGLHCDYRFVVFSDLGRSLQSILDDNAKKLTEKAALQIGIRLLDALEYLHANEYTHGDVTAENVYVNPADLTEVTLANYCFAFRYFPGGNHVPQREGSRTPHEGTLEFISLDSHKGAAPSRRSDLESLGYCLVKWLCGVLPWSGEQTDPCAVMEKKERYKADIFKNPRLSSHWRTVPDALKSYLEQVMSLDYDEKPDYEGLRTFLTRPLELMGASAYDPVDLKVVP